MSPSLHLPASSLSLLPSLSLYLSPCHPPPTPHPPSPVDCLSWFVKSSWPAPQRGQVRCQAGWHKVFHSSVQQTSQWWVSTLVVTVTFDGYVGGVGDDGGYGRECWGEQLVSWQPEFLNTFICHLLKMSWCWRETWQKEMYCFFI